MALTKKSRLRKQRRKKGANRPQGRPGTDLENLLCHRDAVLELLSTNWARIGWRLLRASSPQAIRKALRPLKGASSLDSWIALFIRQHTEKATSREIRTTERMMGLEAEKTLAVQVKYAELSRKFDVADAAISLDDRTDQTISDELRRRGDEMEECERELFASNCKLDDLQEKLVDQRAQFAQSQLLRFKARGYASNPVVLANAMAGLPSIGCRRSFELCSGRESPVWPSARYRIFELIERTWNQRDREPSSSLVDQFSQAILRLPRVIRPNKTIDGRSSKKKAQDNNAYVRDFLCRDWRYLRLALEHVLTKKIHPRAVPFVITSRFFSRRGQPRDAKEQLLADAERLSD